MDHEGNQHFGGIVHNLQIVLPVNHATVNHEVFIPGVRQCEKVLLKSVVTGLIAETAAGAPVQVKYQLVCPELFLNISSSVGAAGAVNVAHSLAVYRGNYADSSIYPFDMDLYLNNLPNVLHFGLVFPVWGAGASAIANIDLIILNLEITLPPGVPIYRNA